MKSLALKLWVLVVVAVALTVMLLPVGGLIGMREQPLFPVQELKIRGPLKRVSTDQLRAALAPAIGNGLFAVDPQRAKALLEEVPWVERAEVRKLWPNTLSIRYEESTVMARWGEHMLLTENGRPIEVPRAEALGDMPLLAGPEARKPELVRFYKALEPSLKEHQLQLSSVRFSPGGSLLVTLVDGLEIELGSDDYLIRWKRFVTAWPQLRIDAGQRGLQRVDARYSHALAVRFGTPSNPETPDQAVAQGNAESGDLPL